jgi:hypothetical protein
MNVLVQVMFVAACCAILAANEAKQAADPVTMITVGINIQSEAARSYMRSLASDPSYYFSVGSYSQLPALVEGLVAAACKPKVSRHLWTHATKLVANFKSIHIHAVLGNGSCHNNELVASHQQYGHNLSCAHWLNTCYYVLECMNAS